jgi:molecular chaperone HscB
MQLLQKNHFELMALPQAFQIDAVRLDRAYRALQAAVHPDRFVNQPPAERRWAMQAATLANEAWRCLRDPVQRAVYLLSLHGVAVDETSRSGFDADFLMQQLEWRERLESLSASDEDDAALQQLAAEVCGLRDDLIGQLVRLIDIERRHQDAATTVRQLMFIERFLDSIDAIDDARD